MMPSDPLWYKDAVIYQTHVKSFFDASNDGIGDFEGLTRKLDYLQHLGVTAVWLLPFYPSPLRDDGYDIADYTNIHPNYGTLRDFKNFLREAHRRGLRVITELVINHTSDRHPWFQRARRSRPGSRWRDFYVWSDGPERYKDARIIFQDFETSNWSWDPVAGAYYWHRFYHHQPDLNYDNPEVHRAVFQWLDHWLELGVDGMRLDAVPYLYQREGTNCENLPETHQFLKKLRAHVDAKYENRMVLAEANQWPEDAVAYFGDGDECHTAFHFPVMPRLFMGVHMEDRFPIIDILEQTPQIPDNCQWVLFLRNHDELTLEMVTDEERDYMYRVYARDRQARINLGIRRRLAPLLGNNRRKIELLNGLLMSLPGTPVIYYGDEIGMGDNIYLGDRDSVRTPMQWSADRNAGFSRANPQQLYLPAIIDYEYHYEALNVETQHNNPHSLFWWTKRLIALRQQLKAFGRGELEFLYPENAKVLAFLRHYEDEHVLVVANLSRYSQYVELDLSTYHSYTPREMFGRNDFPLIGDLPYLLTLGPHAFYWFVLQHPSELQPQRQRLPVGREGTPVEPPELQVRGTWDNILAAPAVQTLEKVLPAFLRTRRWFGGKARNIQGAHVVDVIPVGPTPKQPRFRLLLVRVDYVEGEAETYLLPLGFLGEDEARWRELHEQLTPLARLRVQRDKQPVHGTLYDATGDGDFGQALLSLIGSRRRFLGNSGCKVVGRPAKVFRRLRGPDSQPLAVSLLGAEQSNSSLIYEDRLLLKLFRKVEEGLNPDLEIGTFLTDVAGFRNIPPVAGAVEYQTASGDPWTLAILQGFVRNEGDAWQHTLDAVGRYYERILTEQVPSSLEELEQPPRPRPLLDMIAADVPPLAEDLFGSYLVSAEMLGQRTAELHLALATPTDDPRFTAEPFSRLYQRSMYQRSRSQVKRIMRLLKQRLDSVPSHARHDAETVLSCQEQVMERFGQLLEQKIETTRIRCHGDYHLGQVLFTGKDFIIIDFEGEPARPIGERRIKRSPLQDVAGMLRSFHYAGYCALADQAAGLPAADQEVAPLLPWVSFWVQWSSAAFLKAYLSTDAQASFIPRRREDIQLLLDVSLLDKAVYELGYELNNRPDWVHVPLKGILELLEVEPSQARSSS